MCAFQSMNGFIDMQINFGSIELPSEGAAVFLVEKDKPFEGLVAEVDNLTSGALSKAKDVSRFTGAAGQSLEVTAPTGVKADRVVLVGVGDASGLTELKWAETGGSVSLCCNREQRQQKRFSCS